MCIRDSDNNIWYFNTALLKTKKIGKLLNFFEYGMLYKAVNFSEVALCDIYNKDVPLMRNCEITRKRELEEFNIVNNITC